MPDIAFHFNMPDKLAYACRLLRKATGSGAKVVVTGAAPTLAHLNTLLWTFAPLEFIAHCDERAPQNLRENSPVLLLSDVSASPHQQVLLNLGADIAAGFESFGRVIELVSLDGDDRLQARQRWKRYQDLGHNITKFDVAAKAQGQS
jgi:DNA polymerase III subunit chi